MSSATSPATLAGETNGRRAARFGSEFGSRVAWGAPGTMWWQCRLLRKCEEELGTTTCSPQKVLAIAFKLGKTRRGVTFYVPFGPGFLSQVRQPSLQPETTAWTSRRSSSGSLARRKCRAGASEASSSIGELLAPWDSWKPSSARLRSDAARDVRDVGGGSRRLQLGLGSLRVCSRMDPSKM